MPITLLPDRGVLEVAGEDRVAFLQGLVSNDVAEAAPGRAVWAALLTPQGKWLADFFVFSDGERRCCSTASGRRRRASLRACRASACAPGFRCAMLRTSSPCMPAGTARRCRQGVDGRAPIRAWPRPGWRALAPAPLPDADATPEDWDRHRLGLGLPDGSRDMAAEQSVLLEAGFDELARHLLDQGLLHGPGADGAHALPRPAEAPPRPGGRGRSAAAARHAGAVGRRRGGGRDALRAETGWAWRCCGWRRWTGARCAAGRRR